MSALCQKQTFRLWLRDCLMPRPGCRSPGALLCLYSALVKNLRLRSIVCAARHGLSRVMLLSKAWGKRRVSACVSVHHCHWNWHSSRICTVVFITRGGEWNSFRPNALTCSTRLKAAWERPRRSYACLVGPSCELALSEGALFR
jgi:hypothetical protein